MDKKVFQNLSVCKKCGGRCCNSIPGRALPEDFFINETLSPKLILKALKSGFWSLNSMHFEPSVYFLQPKVKGEPTTRPIDNRYLGSCVFLDKKGCRLKPQMRPHECRMVEPKDGEKPCIQHGFSGPNIPREWEKYQEVIRKIIEDL